VNEDVAHLVWAVLGLVFTVTIVCPAIYKRRKR
jgi:hypothetical protein